MLDIPFQSQYDEPRLPGTDPECHRVAFDWHGVSPGSACPSPRSGHAMITHSASNSIFVFGGLGYGDNCLNDLWRLDVGEGRWQPLRTHGQPPSKVFGKGHTLLRDGRRWFMYGGIGVGDDHYNEVHILDLQTLRWCDLTAQLQLRPLWGHSVSSVLIAGREKLVVIGGMESDRCNECVKIIDLAFLSVERRSIAASSASRLLTPQYRMPLRRRHGAVVYQDAFVIIAGGRNAEIFLNDMWAYHVPNDEWIPLTVASTREEVAAFFSNGNAEAAHSIRLAYSAMRDATRGRRIMHEFSSMYPRTGLSMFMHKTLVYVFGGFFWTWERSCSFNDVHVYDITAHCWRVVEEIPSPPSSQSTPVKASQVSPRPTTMAAICELPSGPSPDGGSQWLLFGGRYGNIPTAAQYIVHMMPPRKDLSFLAARWLRESGARTKSVMSACPPVCVAMLKYEEVFVTHYCEPGAPEHITHEIDAEVLAQLVEAQEEDLFDNEEDLAADESSDPSWEDTEDDDDEDSAVGSRSS